MAKVKATITINCLDNGYYTAIVKAGREVIHQDGPHHTPQAAFQPAMQAYDRRVAEGI